MDNDFKIKELERITKEFVNKMKDIQREYPFLTKENSNMLHLIGSKKMELGYKERSLIALVPFYMKDILPEGTTLKSINGENIVIGTDKISDDSRMGMLAYGFEMEEEINVVNVNYHPIIGSEVNLNGTEIKVENYLFFTSGAGNAWYSMVEGNCPKDPGIIYAVTVEGRFVKSIFREGERLTILNGKFMR